MRLIFLNLSFMLLLQAGGLLDVDWSSVEKSAQQKTSKAYPKVLVEGIKEVRLPVYLSTSFIENKSMVVVADKGFYSISFSLNGATLLFEGDRTYQESVSPKNPEFQKIVQKAGALEISESEGVMVAEFKRHGVNYAISIECENPKTDKRCTQENFIKNLYGSLKMVGGHP